MILWLKMDASDVCLNSASGDNFMLMQNGEPKRLPKDRGLYRNWGAYFDEGDALVSQNEPIKIDYKVWTLTVWITLPVVKS